MGLDGDAMPVGRGRSMRDACVDAWEALCDAMEPKKCRLRRELRAKDRRIADLKRSVEGQKKVIEALKVKQAHAMGIKTQSAPGKPVILPPNTVLGPGDARFTDTLNENFDKMETFARATLEREDLHAAAIDALDKRIQDLEAAALGEPLEELT